MKLIINELSAGGAAKHPVPADAIKWEQAEGMKFEHVQFQRPIELSTETTAAQTYGAGTLLIRRLYKKRQEFATCSQRAFVAAYPKIELVPFSLLGSENQK